MQAEVRVITSPSSSISLVSFGTAEFEEVARRLGVVSNPLLPFCVVIRNERDQPITALAVQYSLAGAERTEVENIVSDGFNLPNRPSVVAPKSQAIVGPGVVISSTTSPSGRALRSTAFVDGTLSQLQAMRDIEVSLDSALFADGILVGPDKSQAIYSIVVRQQVAAQVGSAVNVMIDKGESPSTWLKNLAQQSGGSPGLGQIVAE